VRRRSFLTSVFASALAGAAKTTPVIDTHIHLFDVSRPQGVPWPPKDSPIYKTALPDRYRKIATRFGIAGAIEIECSPWLADNDWVLDVAAKDTIVVGTIGDLEPADPAFAKQLERLNSNPLFRGIRYGNIWDRDLGKSLANTTFIDGLKRLASAKLVLDTANPDPALIHAVVRVTDSIPNLTVVIDHLPGLAVPTDAAAHNKCLADLKLLGQRPQVFAKVSGIVRNVNGRVPLDIGFYRDRLDRIWDIFGADRLMYGSDWPNGDQWAQYPDVFRLANEFITARDPATIEKFFWKNSLRAYAWKKRAPNQPSLSV
jgi:L-fuconolactonase